MHFNMGRGRTAVEAGAVLLVEVRRVISIFHTPSRHSSVFTALYCDTIFMTYIGGGSSYAAARGNINVIGTAYGNNPNWEECRANGLAAPGSSSPFPGCDGYVSIQCLSPPTLAPSAMPTYAPSSSPTLAPSTSPTLVPSALRTSTPTPQISLAPTLRPSHGSGETHQESPPLPNKPHTNIASPDNKGPALRPRMSAIAIGAAGGVGGVVAIAGVVGWAYWRRHDRVLRLSKESAAGKEGAAGDVSDIEMLISAQDK
jgi:hypothetical protein